MKHTKELKEKLVQEYCEGVAVKDLIRKYNVSRSTVYEWVKMYKTQINKKTNEIFNYKQLIEEQKASQKTALELEILKDAQCFDAAPRKTKLEAIERLFGKYKVKVMCRVLKVDTATFYNYHFRRVEKTTYEIRDEALKEKISLVYEESEHRFGAKKITAKLQSMGEIVSMQKVSSLMKQMDIKSKQCKKRVFIQRESKRPCLPHLLHREFTQKQPNLFWVGDITQIKIVKLNFYLCVIIDLFSRKVIAHRLSGQSTNNLVINTFNDAYELRGQPKGLSFHSDRGGQYVSKEFQELLRFYGVKQSCSKAYNPYDNAVVESFFSKFKKEEINCGHFEDFLDLKTKINKYMDFYNGYRPHESLGNMTPNQKEIEYYNK